jgi:thiosulfate reductase cytochrome b subunit
VTEAPLPTQLRRMIGGYQVTRAIHVAAVLGIADLLEGVPRA